MSILDVTQELFPLVWNCDVTHQLKRYQILHQCVLEWHEYTIRIFENSRSTGGSCCWFHDKCVEGNPGPIILRFHPSGTHFAVLVTSNSNEQRRQFLFHLDHNDVPIS